MDFEVVAEGLQKVRSPRPSARSCWRVTASGTGKLFKCRWPRPGLKLAFNA